MIVVKFGRWNGQYTEWLYYGRIYYKGRRTPFCRLEWRPTAMVLASRRYRFCHWLHRRWLWLAAVMPWLFVLAQCLSQACPGGVCPLP